MENDPPQDPYGTSGSRVLSREDIRPEDIRELTIRNLDTGEEFIIGENDPDFEFDTFPLSGLGEGLPPLLSPFNRFFFCFFRWFAWSRKGSLVPLYLVLVLS